MAALTVIGFVGPARDDPQMAALVRTTLGLALLLTAAKLVLRRPLLAAVERRRQGRNASLRPRSRDALTVAVGATLGLLVSVTSVGAGALGMTALFGLYSRMATHRLVASDIAHAGLSLSSAGRDTGISRGGDFPMLRSLLLASIPGILIGSLLSSRTPDHVLRPILAAVLATVGLRLAWA